MTFGYRTLLIGLALLAALSVSADVVEEIVIKVNDSIITKSEYEARVESTRAGMSREYKGPDLEMRLKEVPTLLLRQMEEELLLIEKAKQMYQIDLLVDYQVENVMKEYGLKTKEELAQVLTKEGMTMEAFRKQLLMVYVPEFIKSREVRPSIALDSGEIEAFYEAHKDELVSEPSVNLQEILLSKDLISPEDAANLAGEIARQFAAGRAFGELAALYSNASSRSSGGNAGWFQPTDLSQDLAEAVFETAEGKLTPLLPTPTGWYIFLVKERKMPTVPTLEESRERIVAVIQEQKFHDAYKDYIDELREENYVRINPKYI